MLAIYISFGRKAVVVQLFKIQISEAPKIWADEIKKIITQRNGSAFFWWDMDIGASPPLHI